MVDAKEPIRLLSFVSCSIGQIFYVIHRSY